MTTQQASPNCPRCGETRPERFYRRSVRDQTFRRLCKDCYHWNRPPAGHWEKLADTLRRRGPRPSIPTLRTELGEPKTCYLCGDEVTWETSEIDHVVPLSRGGDNAISNLAWTHRRCNRIKWDLEVDELRVLAQQIADHLRESG